MPEIDAVLTITPLPWARMTGRQCFMPRNVLVRVTAMTRFQLSSEISSSGAGSARPALFIMTSSRPNVSRARRIVRSIAAWSAASILMAAARPPLACDARGYRLGARAAQVGDDHRGALPGKAPRAGGADP